jgi:hypothetical protein
MIAPPSLPLLVQHSQWIVIGTVQAVLWDAYRPGAGEPPAFYPDQVLAVRVQAGLKDTRSAWARLRERGPALVLKPYNMRHLAPGEAGIFFLTRNAIPKQGGAPYALAAVQTGYLAVGLGQPYVVGGLRPRWVSNGLDGPLPVDLLAAVRAVVVAGHV